MPVWSDEGNPPGPLNYRQIEELIAFLREQRESIIDGKLRTRAAHSTLKFGYCANRSAIPSKSCSRLPRC